MLIFLLWPLNEPHYPYSTVITARDGSLLSASVAEDGQWRFPQPDSIPHKLKTCIRLYEDEYFYYHPGVNPFSVIRAAWQNISHGKVVSGASTLTMQVARMMQNQDRTMGNKLMEMFLALKLEWKYSKDELMVKYASMAPFGGNVVGADAASWRYYGKPFYLLSWAEAATLAVLPNNPANIFPGQGPSQLKQKRNFLLHKLFQKDIIDSLTYSLALEEAVPGRPYKIPTQANQLLTRINQAHKGSYTQSTLVPFWQERVHTLAEAHRRHWVANGVDNVAALVVDLTDGSVLAYKGNTDDPHADSYQVDMISSVRSPGSSLKPMLYAAALDKGLIMKRTLLPDIPSFFGGFVPKNFSLGYEGAVPAHKALSRSLNIPFAHLLQDYSYQQFYYDLEAWGITTLDQHAGHYGLSLVLGGCEVSMWEMSQVYFSFYRKMAGLPNMAIRFDEKETPLKNIGLGKDAIWQTFNTMTHLARPEGERSWRTFSSSQLISWKTGTSHGHRDAWAVGINGEILVCVWVGNADGEGRPGLTGIKAAAPLLHNILKLSDYQSDWLESLRPPMMKKDVCIKSGMLPGPHCPTQQEYVVKNAEKSGVCPYHQLVRLDADGKYRVRSECFTLARSVERVVFALPSIMGHYYRKENSDYQGLPPVHPDCQESQNPVAIIYPNSGSKVFIPREITGEKGRVVLQAYHQQANVRLYWHVDDNYLGHTDEDHQMEVWLEPGIHTLTLWDETGNKVSRQFEVMGKE